MDIGAIDATQFIQLAGGFICSVSMQIWEAAVEWQANSSSSRHMHTHKLILPKWLCQANQQSPQKEGRWEKSWTDGKQLIITSTSI